MPQKWNDLFMKKGYKPPSIIESVQNLNESWNEISESLIIKSWNFNKDSILQEEEETFQELTSEYNSEI